MTIRRNIQDHIAYRGQEELEEEGRKKREELTLVLELWSEIFPYARSLFIVVEVGVRILDPPPLFYSKRPGPRLEKLKIFLF